MRILMVAAAGLRLLRAVTTAAILRRLRRRLFGEEGTILGAAPERNANRSVARSTSGRFEFLFVFFLMDFAGRWLMLRIVR